MAHTVYVGRYEAVRRLARGDTADVHLARDLLLDRPVALKVLHPEFGRDRAVVERFQREARASANLNHPNIVPAYDWGEEDDSRFIVKEYVDGPTLKQVIASEGPIDSNRVAAIGADIAAGLAAVHEHGMIHGDVKPGKVMISAAVRILISGLVRRPDAGPEGGFEVGTATYLSPEQAQGLAIDVRSDLYSLGIVLYEMATGRPPFIGDNPVAVAHQHVRGKLVAASRLNPEVTPALEAIVTRMLAKDRDKRYSSAEVLRLDLLTIPGRVRTRPTVTKPDGPARNTPSRSPRPAARTERPAAEPGPASRAETQQAGAQRRRTLKRALDAGIKAGEAAPASAAPGADAQLRLFISYRRDDTEGHAGRLYDSLVQHFGPEHIFMDIDRMVPGDDFVETINQAIAGSNVALVIIGRAWLTIVDPKGRRRLDQTNDWVRLEIETALRHGIRTIPVLVHDAEMPAAEELPDALAPLARRHAFRIGPRWHADVDQLIRTLEEAKARDSRSR